MNHLRQYVERMRGGRILVIGDLILDEFIWGKVSRISPEAPVPVVEVGRESLHLGGAANVANNLRALGAQVHLSGIIGADDVGRTMRRLLASLGVDAGGVQEDPARMTSRKSRVIAQHQQVVRVDRENLQPISEAQRASILEHARRLVPEIHGIIISDYGKGVVSRELVAGIMKMAGDAGLPVSVDPKVKNFHLYEGVTLITPNKMEASQGIGLEIHDEKTLVEAGRRILAKLRCRYLLITRGEEGMILFDGPGGFRSIDTAAREVFDVTGAGDTVISAMTLAMAVGVPPFESAMLANYAAGIVVGKLGTATVSPEELLKVLP